MAKVVQCAKMDPMIRCSYVARGETEEEVLRKAVLHAEYHGIRQVTPELLERVRANIHDE